MTSDMDSNLALTDELCELTLALALRHFSPVLNSHADVPHSICAYLNANLRAAIPAASRAALVRLTWIDLDVAFRVGDLWLLDTMRVMHPLVRPLQYSLRVLTAAAQAGSVHVLEWWRRTWTAGHRGQPIIYADVDRIMDAASEFGHVRVLEWCVKQEQVLAFEFSERAMDKASGAGFVHVLEWWLEKHRQTGRELKYTAAAVDSASAAGHLAVLQWWKDKSAKLPFKFSPEKAFPQTVSQELLPVYVWWKYSGFVVIRNLSKITESAVKSNRLGLLKWVRENGYLQVEPRHVFLACSVANVKLQTVEFLWQHLPAESKSDLNASPAFVAASRAGRLDLLDYFEALGLEWADGTVDQAATQSDDLKVLNWWLEREPAWNVSTIRNVLSQASRTGNVALLNWMRNEDEGNMLREGGTEPPVFDRDTLVQMLGNAFHSKRFDALDWWESFNWDDRFGALNSSPAHEHIQNKFSHLLNVAIITNWTDYVAWAYKKGHTLSLDTSLVVSSHEGVDAFEKCLELYCDVMDPGPSTDWKYLGISDPIGWAKLGIETACRAGNLQALDFYLKCSTSTPAGGYNGLVTASSLGYNQVMQWWLAKGLPLENRDASCNAVCLNPFGWDFWSLHKDQMPFKVAPPTVTRSFMLFVPEHKRTVALAALSSALKSNVVPNPGAGFVLELSSAGLASHLEWWFAYLGRPAKAWSQVSGEAMVLATSSQWIPVLDWWKHSGIKLQVPFGHIDEVRGSFKTVAWWRASGLVEVS